MKNIAIFSDGTWNFPGMRDGNVTVQTNVQKLHELTATGTTVRSGMPLQVKVYDSGVGTPGHGLLSQLQGGITGAGLDKNIRDLYRFLITQYERGDRIFLFGFSRGAYTVRSLAGLIRNCGILRPEYIHLTDTAFELYRDRNNYSRPDSDLMIGFKERYAYETVTRIRMIGVWDTVGSLGIPAPYLNILTADRYRFHDTTLSSTVEYAYQALAIDEVRVPFAPVLWKISKYANTIFPQTLEQRWFPGVHSNIGGGYANNSLSNIPLVWIALKAVQAGLHLHSEPITYSSDYMDNIGSPWFPLTLLWQRKRRITVDHSESNQSVDATAYRRRNDPNCRYRPQNLP
ncbi:MAG: DUF2235 domain-containing protein [Chlorobi bacterium]|nr:MAG: DUF2235 domain-containing protein [Bacteroidota bacterium]KXK35816.1 MAG: hypothetical protein UZ06_CHB003000285 [Chlorobi bacterium OLB6]MBE2265360.1 DUF2235 domain-containing protein [Flavobacteriales bacterium]MBL1160313.1 DUF2235 domain-containing protein [Chlorobiota bacterium]MBW7853452.1 DUF2235 domain-containing protein [Candidatus Kapabacteria bacterium]MCC6330498.1 DUF2235 domain-containing protein [Ignavibacteria bacterium]